MTQQTLEKSLMGMSNQSAWITSSKLRKWLGYGDEKFRAFVSGMDVRISGNRRMYFIGDVAAKIMEERHEV